MANNGIYINEDYPDGSLVWSGPGIYQDHYWTHLVGGNWRNYQLIKIGELKDRQLLELPQTESLEELPFGYVEA